MHRFRLWTFDPPEFRTQRNRLLPIEGGDGSTLSLNFTTGILDPRLSFTRSTIGTYIGSDGLVKTMAAAPTNDPTKARFDHDPTTLAPRGLLIEGTATNLALRSQELNTSPWIKAASVTVSQSGSGSPANDSTSNIVTWANGASAGGAYLQQNVTVSSGSLVVNTPYTWSVWLKSNSGRRINIFAFILGVSGNREIRVDFSVSPPTVSAVAGTGWTSIQTPTITEYPNGWYRITTGGTLPASTTSVNFGFSNTDVVPGSGTNGFEAWGFQLESGFGSSSYIPTVGSQVTREADFVLMSDISSVGFNTVSGGTLFVDWYYTKNNPSSYPCGVGFMGATDSPSPSFEQFTNSTNIHSSARGSSISNLERLTTYSLNTQLKFAASFDLTSSPISLRTNLNGTAASDTDAGSGPLFTPTRFVISRPGYGLYLASGIIKTVKYWPITKTATELASLVV